MMMSHTILDNSVLICPFTVAVDTREKAPYRFHNIPLARRPKRSINGPPPRLIVKTKEIFLPTGDYSITTMIHDVVIERKSLEDLYSTLGRNRDRFEHEIEKLNRCYVAAVVIEADLRQVMRPSQFRPAWRSRLNPKSVYSTWQSWSQRYRNVHWHFAGSRRTAEIVTFHLLERFYLDQESSAKRHLSNVSTN